MKYQNRADLLIAAGNSIKMQESFRIIPVGKHMDSGPWALKDYRFEAGDEWEFPLTVVEGIPVFIGDELYDHDVLYCKNPKFTVDRSHSIGLSKTVSWLPPKPATVMVELPIEWVEWMAGNTDDIFSGLGEQATNACRKALEQIK